MNHLPLDILRLIIDHLPFEDVRDLTATCSRLYRLRNLLFITIAQRNLSFKSFNLLNLKLIQDEGWGFNVPYNVTQFRYVVKTLIEGHLWYLTWNDLNMEIKTFLQNWINYILNLSIDYQLECSFGSEYVLATFFDILWMIRRKYGFLFQVRIDYYQPVLELFMLHEDPFSFRMTFFILNKMTDYRYRRLIHRTCLNYCKSIDDSVPDGTKYHLLLKIKQYCPKLFYSKINKLKLSRKQWTSIYIAEVRWLKRRRNDVELLDGSCLADHYSNKPIFFRTIKKLFGEQYCCYSWLYWD